MSDLVFCIVALIVFGVLGIFSASHRKMAKEAFACVFRMVTLRKCESSFDQKMKVRISAGLLKRNKTVGNFVFKHFESLSWVLVVLTIGSIVFSGIGLYNWWAFGNCNGPDSDVFCPLNALSDQPTCSGPGNPSQIVGFPSLENGVLMGNPNSRLTIVEFGCFLCPFTAKSEPFVQLALAEFGGEVSVLWKSLPLPGHAFSREAEVAAFCANKQDSFLAYRQKLFENQSVLDVQGEQGFLALAKGLGLDETLFSRCLSSEEAGLHVLASETEATNLNLYATPTFFIGEKVLVGLVSYDELKNAILEELNNSS